MSAASKRILKMGAFFTLFIIPFLLCIAGMCGLTGSVLISVPWAGGSFEPYGLGLVFTGLGAALFGRELFEAIQDLRWVRRHRRPKKKNDTA